MDSEKYKRILHRYCVTETSSNINVRAMVPLWKNVSCCSIVITYINEL